MWRKVKQDTNINSLDYQNSNVHNFSNKTFMCILALIICVLFICISIICYLLIKNNNNDSSENDVSNNVNASVSLTGTTSISTTTSVQITTTSATTIKKTKRTTTKINKLFMPIKKHYYPGENEGDVYYNTGSKKYLYYGPDSNSYGKTGAYVDEGTRFREQGRSDSKGTWLYVQNDRRAIGWIKFSYDFEELVVEPEDTYSDIFNGEILRDTGFRLGPNDKRDFVNKIDFSIPKVISKGKEVYIYGYTDNWYYISYNGHDGWVKMRDIEL